MLESVSCSRPARAPLRPYARVHRQLDFISAELSSFFQRGQLGRSAFPLTLYLLTPGFVYYSIIRKKSTPGFYWFPAGSVRRSPGWLRDSAFCIFNREHSAFLIFRPPRRAAVPDGRVDGIAES